MLAAAIAAALALGATAALYFFVLQPQARMLASLRRLAGGHFDPPPLSESRGPFPNAIRDIRTLSERLQQMEQQISDEGFSLRAILSGMREGVLIADRSLRVRLANDALIQFFGLNDAPLNRPVIEIFRNHEIQHALETTLADGIPKTLALTLDLPAPDGGLQTKHLEINIAGLRPAPDARPTGALVVFHDMTDVRNLETAQRELLANVSHEFRTPLAIITGYVETLMDGALDDPHMAQRSLLAMHKNSSRLALLIDDMLTMSHLDARGKRLEFQPANLRDILHHVLENLAHTITGRGANVTVDWPDEAAHAEVDARRMEQVCLNLVGNALRYGGRTLHISASRRDDELCIRFADNGPGIPLSDQPRIFERFYRVHKDRSRDAGGTGLGLSIVKNIMEAHGGHVSLESTPGAGATFQICFPITQGAAASA
jgi:two-component system phosphate regulon sensor histidine kinase PhoR